MKIVRDIEDRLQGKHHHKSKGLPLSVEGQVHAVIKVKIGIRLDILIGCSLARFVFRSKWLGMESNICGRTKKA